MFTWLRTGNKQYCSAENGNCQCKQCACLQLVQPKPIFLCKSWLEESTKETVSTYIQLMLGPNGRMTTVVDEEEAVRSRSGSISGFGLAWDARRGRWISLVYRYVFPKTPFQHTNTSTTSSHTHLGTRRGRFEFGPCKQHNMTISPNPWHSLRNKRPFLSEADYSQNEDVESDELTDGMVRSELPLDMFRSDVVDDNFLMHDFLSSAVIQGDETGGLTGPAFNDFGALVMPSSPPPPLFLDGSCPIPDLQY